MKNQKNCLKIMKGCEKSMVELEEDLRLLQTFKEKLKELGESL